MTVFFNQRWNGYPQFSIASLDIHNERDLIAKGIASEVECLPLVGKTTAGGIELSRINKRGMPRMYIKVVTFESAESLKIGFGDSEAAAKTAAGTGVELKGEEEITVDIPAESTHFGFVSVGGNVDFYCTFCQG